MVTAPRTQVAFSAQKGSIPIRPDIDASTLDVCARMGIAILKDKSRVVGNDENYLTPDQNGALSDILTDVLESATCRSKRCRSSSPRR